MKVLLVALHFLVLANIAPWVTDFEQAKKDAAQKHELILLNFSGSDWCGPCMKIHKEIFNTAAFSDAFGEKLIMFNADFPRLKKNRLAEAQQKQNDMLAEKYNPNGHFPFTLLLDCNGKVLKTWEGFPRDGSAAFMEELKHTIDESH